MEEINDIKLKRVKNLKMFKGKTDEEIREYYRNRDPKPELIEASPISAIVDEQEYEKKYKAKVKTLKDEYGDLNESDMELVRTLARLTVQLEVSNTAIIRMQQDEEMDTRNLKNLGDYQRQLVQSINELQDKLGIARKQRKEKNVDDVAIFIESLKKKSKDFFDRKTVQVRCEKDQIELARYWLNFPKNTKAVHFEVTCWKCGEERVYTV